MLSLNGAVSLMKLCKKKKKKRKKDRKELVNRNVVVERHLVAQNPRIDPPVCNLCLINKL